MKITIPEHLKLKSPKEKILSYQTVRKIEIDPETEEEIDLGDRVKYLYVSEELVPQATHKGLTEDMSRRTANAQFFKKETKIRI